jgi:hypothetical protein
MDYFSKELVVMDNLENFFEMRLIQMNSGSTATSYR